MLFEVVPTSDFGTAKMQFGPLFDVQGAIVQHWHSTSSMLED